MSSFFSNEDSHLLQKKKKKKNFNALNNMILGYIIYAKFTKDQNFIGGCSTIIYVTISTH